ncbi:hypothetical protein K8R42_05425 [bacterium]|nr:hypothetical protein [bacterium]
MDQTNNQMNPIPSVPVTPSHDSGQALGLEQHRPEQGSYKKGPKLKLIIPIVIIVLFLAGSALAYFTDLKYKIPFFRPNTSELVGLMYEKISQLDGADFALTYHVNVGPRDADAPVPEEKEKKDLDSLEGLSGVEGSDTMDFLSGEIFSNSWGLFEEMIPDDFDAQLTFVGSGFSFSQRQAEKEKLPDLGISLSGEGEFGSMTMKIGAEDRVVDDAV